jgi:hypothetical protein
VVAANAILSDVPGRMRPEWHGVVRDLGLFIGETIIGRSDGQLHWAFFEKGRRDVAFQRHVLMGFSRAANPKYNVNPEAIVGMLAHSLAQRDRFAEPPVPEGRFLRVVQTALEYA